MKRKSIILLFAGMMTISVVGCGNNSSSSNINSYSDTISSDLADSSFDVSESNEDDVNDTVENADPSTLLGFFRNTTETTELPLGHWDSQSKKINVVASVSGIPGNALVSDGQGLFSYATDRYDDMLVINSSNSKPASEYGASKDVWEHVQVCDEYTDDKSSYLDVRAGDTWDTKKNDIPADAVSISGTNGAEAYVYTSENCVYTVVAKGAIWVELCLKVCLDENGDILVVKNALAIGEEMGKMVSFTE